MKLAPVIVLSVMATVAAQPQFRSGVDIVTVDVLVTRGGRPVTGLTAADFELRDSGVRQQVQSVVVDDVPLNVLVALDTSGSVGGAPLQHLKDAAGAAIARLTAQDQVALLCFNEGIQVWMPWTSDLQAMKARVDAVQPAGGTALHDAAFAALMLQNPRPGARSLLLLFTDGDDTTGWLPGQHVIDAARRAETVVYGFGPRRGRSAQPGYRVDFRSGLQPPIPHMAPLALTETFLENLATETGGRHVDVQDSGKLRDRVADILTEFRSRYLLAYTPGGVPASGWHPIQVKLTRHAGDVRARRGYQRDAAPEPRTPR